MKNAIPIDRFRHDEIKSLEKEFREKKEGDLFIEKEVDTKTGETVFVAKLRDVKKWKICGRSRDPHHAKDKLLAKLRNYIQKQGTRKMFPSHISKKVRKICMVA